MVYLFEVELLESKSVFICLTSILGIGQFNAFLICKKVGFSKNLKINSVSKNQLYQIIKIIDYLKFRITSILKKFNVLNIKKLILIKCFKGFRKIKGLPLRGQRTRTNSRTTRKKY